MTITQPSPIFALLPIFRASLTPYPLLVDGRGRGVRCFKLEKLFGKRQALVLGIIRNDA